MVTFVEDVQTFAVLAQRYENHCSEISPDALYQALLKNSDPAATKTQVDMASFTHASSTWRDALLQYTQVPEHIFEPCGPAADEATPMDIGHAKGAKHAGKGKTNESGEGKANNNGRKVGKKGDEKGDQHKFYGLLFKQVWQAGAQGEGVSGSSYPCSERGHSQSEVARGKVQRRDHGSVGRAALDIIGSARCTQR